MTELTAPLSATRLRGGVRYWLDSYRALTRWHLASLRMWLMLLTVILGDGGAGFVLGIALFFDHIPASAALFVCTGVPVINLMIVGPILGVGGPAEAPAEL